MVIPKKIPIISFFTSDTSPVLQFTINKTDGTGAFDITGSSSKCKLRLIGSTANVFSGTLEDSTLQSPGTNGRIDYTLPSAITDPGIYHGQLEITLAAGGIQRTQRFQIEIEEGL